MVGIKAAGRVAAAAMAVGSVGAGVALAAPTGAHAATTSICQFTGTTTSLTPIPAPPKTGGHGSFTFSGSATCVTSAGKTLKVSINSSGTYTNTVCGTGVAVGTSSFSGGLKPFNYKITFYSGQGTLAVTSGGKGNGVVDITPANTGGCVTTAVTGFTVRGITQVAQ